MMNRRPQGLPHGALKDALYKGRLVSEFHTSCMKLTTEPMDQEFLTGTRAGSLPDWSGEAAAAGVPHANFLAYSIINAQGTCAVYVAFNPAQVRHAYLCLEFHSKKIEKNAVPDCQALNVGIGILRGQMYACLLQPLY